MRSPELGLPYCSADQPRLPADGFIVGTCLLGTRSTCRKRKWHKLECQTNANLCISPAGGTVGLKQLQEDANGAKRKNGTAVFLLLPVSPCQEIQQPSVALP